MIATPPYLPLKGKFAHSGIILAKAQHVECYQNKGQENCFWFTKFREQKYVLIAQKKKKKKELV